MQDILLAMRETAVLVASPARCRTLMLAASHANALVARAADRRASENLK